MKYKWKFYILKFLFCFFFQTFLISVLLDLLEKYDDTLINKPCSPKTLIIIIL